MADLITATESAIRSDNLILVQAEQLRMKESTALASTKSSFNDFTSKVWEVRLAPEESMVSFDVTSISHAYPDLKQWKPSKNDSYEYNKCFYRMKHSCAMSSLVFPIVANLYMDEVESRALNSI